MNHKVYIVGGDALIERMFISHGIYPVSHPSEATLACFTGGSDVTPSLYDEKNVGSYSDWHRDVAEMADFAEIQELGIPSVGICRGGQFLNVMNGGKMWQNVNNHAIGGTHELKLEFDEGAGPGFYQVTSTHHQMMRHAEGGAVIGKATLATRFEGDNKDRQPDFDTEIVWYGKTNCLCFQPHPEYNGDRDDTEKLFFMLLDGYGFLFDDRQAG